jgi:hypothetical protein
LSKVLKIYDGGRRALNKNCWKNWLAKGNLKPEGI